jgi:hypothetical protein
MEPTNTLIQISDGFDRQSFSLKQRSDMNHHHRKTLHALFAHPISANIDFKKVVHLLEDIGAEVDNKPGNRVGVKLNGHSAALRHAHRELTKEEVVQVRKFLETCGITPAKFPL